MRANNKKKARKAKAEEERAARQAEEARIQAEKDRVAEEKRAYLAAAQAEARAQEQRRREREEKKKHQQQRAARKAQLHSEYAVYEAALLETQKKVKRLSKKLRDICELEKKVEAGGRLSSEQLAKVDKKQELQDDIAEAEEEEELLLQRREKGEFDELLQWVDEIALDACSDDDKGGGDAQQPKQAGDTVPSKGSDITLTDAVAAGDSASCAAVAVNLMKNSQETKSGVDRKSDINTPVKQPEPVEAEWAEVKKPKKKKR